MEMEKEMKYFSLEGKKILLNVATFLAFFGLFSTYGNAEMITGAELKHKINSFLLEKDFLGKPAISEKRLFPACSSEVKIRPLFGGVKTLQLSCSDPGGLKLAVRTNAIRIEENRFDNETQNNVSYDKRNDTYEKSGQLSKKLAKISRGKEFLVLSRSVQKGQILTTEDVTLRSDLAPNMIGYFTKVSDVVGRKVKNSLSINQALLNRHLEIDWDIHKGQKVLIQSDSGPVIVVSYGISKNNAQIGELLQAKNLQSGALVEGIVVSPKKIKVLTK